MNKDIVKGVLSFVGSACAGWLVERYLKTNMITVNRAESIALKVGSWVIGGMVSATASDYIEAEIDEIHDTIKRITNAKDVEVKEA